jgi:hypothetical protein
VWKRLSGHRRAFDLNKLLLSWSLLPLCWQMLHRVMLISLQGLSSHGHLDYFFDMLHMRNFNNLLNSGDVRHIDLLHHRHVHDLFHGLDDGNIHVPLRDSHHWNMALLVHWNFNVGVNKLNLRHFHHLLHCLHHRHLSLRNLWYLLNLLNNLDLRYLNMSLHGLHNWHMSVLVHRDVDMVVHVLDLWYLDSFLHHLDHWHLPLLRHWNMLNPFDNLLVLCRQRRLARRGSPPSTSAGSGMPARR